MIVIEGRVLDLVPKPVRLWLGTAVLLVQPGCMCGCSGPLHHAGKLPAVEKRIEADCPDCARAAERQADAEG